MEDEMAVVDRHYSCIEQGNMSTVEYFRSNKSLIKAEEINITTK
jgi:hypothetical protein